MSRVDNQGIEVLYLMGKCAIQCAFAGSMNKIGLHAAVYIVYIEGHLVIAMNALKVFTHRGSPGCEEREISHIPPGVLKIPEKRTYCVK